MITYFSLEDINILVLKGHSYISNIGIKIIDDKICKGSSILEGHFYQFLDLLDVIESRKDFDTNDDNFQKLVLRLYSQVENQCVYYNSLYLDIEGFPYDNSITIDLTKYVTIEYFNQVINNLPIPESITASNGLTKSGNDIQDGGTLNRITIKNLDGYPYIINHVDSNGQIAEIFNPSEYAISLITKNNVSETRLELLSTNASLRYIDNESGLQQQFYLGGENGIKIVDDFGLKGAVYNADYSALGLTDPLWLPNLGVVQQLIGNQLTASNGLTRVDDDISLGGSLNTNTNLNVNNYLFTIYDSNTPGLFSQWGNSFIKHQKNNADSSSAALVVTDNGIESNYSNTVGDVQSFINSVDGMVSTDNINHIGHVYFADYNTNQLLNDRAITDVGGVRQLISGKANLVGGNSFTGSQNIGTGNLTVTDGNLYVRQTGINKYTYTDATTINAVNPDNSSAILLNANSTTLQWNINSTFSTLHADNVTDSRIWQLPDEDGVLATTGDISKITDNTERLLGTLYDKSTWSNLSDFTDNSSGVTIVSNQLSFTGGTGIYINQLLLSSLGNSVNEKYRSTLRITVGEKSATSYGMIIGMQSTYSGTGKTNIGAKFDMTNTGTSGILSLIGGDVTNGYTNILSSTTALSFSVSDIIDILLERYINVFTAKIRNVTTNSATITISYTMTYIGSGGINQPNMGQHTITNLGGSWIANSISIRSYEIKNATLALFTDSKGRIGTRYLKDNIGALVNNAFTNTVVLSGRGNTTTDMITLLPELIALKPKIALFSFSSNDIRGSVAYATYTANYNYCVVQAEAAGIEVWHISPLYEASLDQTAMTTYINTTYPSSRIIDFNLNSNDSDDGTHMNVQGHLKGYNKIVESGISKNGVNLLAYSTTRDQSNSLLLGLVGGQIVYGGLNSSENLTISSTFNSTKGVIYLGTGQLSQYDEVSNRLLLRTTTGANTITLGNAGNGIAIHNLSTTSTNAEYFEAKWSSNIFSMMVNNLGSGSQRVFKLGLLSGRALTINTVPTSLPTFQFGAGTSGAGAALGVDGTYNASASRQYMVGSAPTISQSGSAGSSIIYAYPFYNTSGSGGDYLVDVGTAATAPDLSGTLNPKLRIDKNGLVTLGTWNGVAITPTYGGTGGDGTTTGTGSNVLSISPTFTGTPLAPTATAGTNTTQIATTAFVMNGRVLTLFNNFTTTGNSTTTETDLISNTTAASQLATNGDRLEAEYGGAFISSGTATREIKVYFGGTVIFDTGALTLSLSSQWTTYVTIVRVSSTIIRYMVSLTTEGAALSAYTAVGEVTGLTLSNTNILKITGQAAGVGAATNDITALLGNVTYYPHA